MRFLGLRRAEENEGRQRNEHRRRGGIRLAGLELGACFTHVSWAQVR